MTTDNKAVARWDLIALGENTTDMCQQDDGDYVLFTDHERVVGELKYWRGLADGYHAERDVGLAALAASRAEVEGLRGAMFAVYCVAANGGNLSRLHTEIERMRDAMEKSNG